MTADAPNTGVSAQSRYDLLSNDRNEFVSRGHRCAQLTIPTVFRENAQHSSNQKIIDPAQSLGARGVSNLAAKMVLSLLPVNTPFFKMNVDKLQLEREAETQQGELDEDALNSLYDEVRKGLGQIEQGVIREIQNSGDVTAVNEMLKHLIIVGNVLVFTGEKGMRLYDLNKYTVVRTPEGQVLEIVVCEMTAPTTLPDEARQLVTASTSPQGDSNERSVPVYTHVTFKDGRVKWHQEIEGQKVPGSESDVPEEGNPWLALRFVRVDGEAYGRSYVEQFLGDFESLEVLTKAINDAAVAASKVVWLVRPNGSTRPRVIAQAPNNDVVSGDSNDVTCLQMDKAQDMRFAQELLNRIEGRIAYAFMVNSEVLRDAERVTAEEVRFVAQELDDSLGGIYSVMSTEFQLPYVKRRLHLMRKQNKIPKLPEIVAPVIVTGFAALGKTHEMDKLKRFIGSVVEMVGPERLEMYVDVDEAITRMGSYEGIETTGLLIGAEKRKQMQAQAQQAQMQEKLSPEMLKQGGQMLQQQMANQQAEGQPNGTAQSAAAQGEG